MMRIARAICRCVAASLFCCATACATGGLKSQPAVGRVTVGVTSRGPALRFRVARRFGYGASPGMVHRCLERLDDEGIPGELRILRVLSDTDPVSTQGPVWYVEGKAV